jgi:hypothetical protein
MMNELCAHVKRFFYVLGKLKRGGKNQQVSLLTANFEKGGGGEKYQKA